MQVGSIKARAGEHAFGVLETVSTRSGLRLDIPVHLFAGAMPGPTLLVQGAVHGTEIIGTIAILNLIAHLDPATMRGNLIAVPVVNRIGFELGERGSRIDGKDVSRLYPGNLHGSASDRIAHVYFHEVISQSDVMIDFHSGGLTAYERYVLFPADRDPGNPSALEQKRRALVVAFGLDTAAFFPPNTFGTNSAQEAIEAAGVVQFTPELGGGTGWLKNGDENVAVAERGIRNILKAMDIIDGDLEADGPECTIYNAKVVLWKPDADGLFIRLRRFGEYVAAGETYGLIVDPYTGKELAHIRNTHDATVIPSGQEWPTVSTTSIGILGTVDAIIDRRTTQQRITFAPGTNARNREAAE